MTPPLTVNGRLAMLRPLSAVSRFAVAVERFASAVMRVSVLP
jgi:hypothetical protein